MYIFFQLSLRRSRVAVSNTIKNVDMSLAFSWSLIVIDTLTILLNGLIFMMFICFRQRLLRSTHNRILCSMALGDTCVGVFGISFGVTLLLTDEAILYKLLGNIPIFSSIFVSSLSLIVLTVDRLVALKKPYVYTSLFYKKLVVKLIVLTWIIPGIIIVLQILLYVKETDTELTIRSFIFVAFFLAGMITLVYSNIILFLGIRAFAKRMQEVAIGTEGHNIQSSADNSYTEDSNGDARRDGEVRLGALIQCGESKTKRKALNKVDVELAPTASARGNISKTRPSANCRRTSYMQNQVTKRQELKITSIICLLTVSVFIILWLPLSAYRFTYAIGKMLQISWLRRLCLCLTIINSLVNPLIYLLVRKEFRSYLKKMVRKCFLE